MGVPFPIAFRPPALASRVIRCPPGIGPSLRSAYRDTSPYPDPVGITTFHTHEMRPGWVPPVSQGRRCSPGRQKIPDRRLPFYSGQPLHPAYHIPSGEAHA